MMTTLRYEDYTVGSKDLRTSAGDGRCLERQ